MNAVPTPPVATLRPRLLVLALLFVLAASYSPAGAGAPAGTSESETGDAAVVATWRGGELRRAEYLDWLQAKGIDDGPEAVRELAFVLSLAQASEARIDPAEDRRIELEVEARRQRILLPRLRQHVVAGLPPTDAEELDRLRAAHPDAFVRPRKLRLRNLYKALGPPDEARRVRAEMDEIYQELRSGADFGQLARRESQSQSRFRDGRLGLVDPDDLPASLAPAVRNLQPGELSPPLEHAGGLTIFLCEEIVPERRPPPDEVRRKLRTNVERRRAAERWAAVQEELIAGVRLDLSSLSHPAPPEVSPATVLEMPGHRLDSADVGILTDLRMPRRSSPELDADALEELLRRWGIGVAGTRRAVELGLARDEPTAARLRWLRTDVLARRELVRRIDERLDEPDDATLRRWYEGHLDRYRQLARFELAAIHFGDPLNVGEARRVTRRLASGDLTFEDAARRHSVHESATGGGYLGWHSSLDLVDWGPAAARAVKSLEPGDTPPGDTATGDVTDLLHAPSGLWIFRLLDRRESGTATFEESRQQVARDLRSHRIGELEQAVRAEHLEAIGFALSPPAASDAAEPIIVRWSTASEHECFGYHVYRSEQRDGPFERLTAEAIEGGGTTDLPRDYRFEDPAVEAGETYFYYVESLSTDGRTERLTPVRAVEARPRLPE